MISYKEGDLTEHKFSELTIVPHIVNNKCINGSGVTIAIDRKWGFIKSLKSFHKEIIWEHLEFNPPESYDCFYYSEWQLGQVHFFKSKNVVVASMIAQTSPGGEIIAGEYLRPIRLDSLYECMLRVKEFAGKINCDNIVSPKFGGLRAGGDFDKEILPMIEKIWSRFNITIYSYKE